MASKGRRGSAEKVPAADEFNFDYDMPVIINVKPEDQLDIPPEELEKEVRTLFCIRNKNKGSKKHMIFIFVNKRSNNPSHPKSISFHLPPPKKPKVEPRVLYPNNPRAPHNITQFSYKERCYKRDEQVDQLVIHSSIDATILKKESPEEIAQQEILERKREEQEKRDAAEAVDVEIEE